MSLFGDLPPVKKADGLKATTEENLDAKLLALQNASIDHLNEANGEAEEGEEEDGEEKNAHADVKQPDEQDDEETERPIKRVKFETDAQASQQAVGDQITAALKRIAPHISNPAKFEKANPLLRKLMDNDDALSSKQHASQLFETIRQAFSRLSMVADPLNRRDYMKIVASISSLVEKQASFFNKAELQHLDVYRLLGHVQGELGTDDSFQFAKSLAKLREEVDDLLAASEEDSQAMVRLNEGGSCWQSAGTAHPEPRDSEGSTTSAWSLIEVQCMKREALVIIVELTLRPIHHKHAWSRTGIELLIEHMHQNKCKFCSGPQQDKVEELMTWVRQQRSLRKKGPSAKEINRDSSSYDRDRKQWSQQDWISKNGKVGASGDAKSSGWLG